MPSSTNMNDGYVAAVLVPANLKLSHVGHSSRLTVETFGNDFESFDIIPVLEYNCLHAEL